ncbi:MAG: glycosyltransferase family 2 protein [Ginsengibacter sp.]
MIANYNVKFFLEHCLSSLVKATTNITTEIFVVDNNSTDGSKHYFQGKFPNVIFIWSKENHGFAKANNLALERASGKYVLFINPDVIVGEHTITACLDFFERTAGAGALGVKMLDGSGAFLKESKRGFPSPATSFFKLSGLSNLFPHSQTFSKYYLGHLDENKDHVVDVLAGAFMLVKKEVLDTTGSFDEAFFMYGEDIDLSFRIHQAGFKNHYLSNPAIIHFKGESTQKRSESYVKHFYGAMIIFVHKHYSGFKAKWYTKLIDIIIIIKAATVKFGVNRKKPLAEPEETAPGNLVVIGSSDECDSVLSIIKSAEIKANILGRVTPQSLDDLPNIGKIDDLNLILKNYKANEVILCEGVMSYENIIQILSTLPQTIKKRFYSNGVSNIISSDNKDISGNIIVYN